MVKRADKESMLAPERRVIKQAKSKDGKRTEYRIMGFPGLVLRCFPTGAASWYAFYTLQVNGRPVTKRVHIDDRDAIDFAEAGKIAQEHLRKSREGHDPALEKQLARHAVTLGDLVQKRLDEVDLAGKLKASTIEQQRSLTNLFFESVPGLKGKLADKITPAEMRAAFQAFVAAGVKRKDGPSAGQPFSNKTRDLVKMAMSAAYRWGQDTGRCENNPLRDIRNSSKSDPRENRASDEDIKRLMDACDDPAAPLSDDMRDVIRLALLTGQRRGEVAKAERGHLDEDVTVWTIPGDRQEYRKGRAITVHGLTKNGKEQIVPLSSEASAVFKAAVARAGERQRLFRVEPGAVTMAMRRLRKKYGIGEVTVHSLRRTIANWAGQEKTIRAEAIEALLNHQPRSDDVTRRHYNQARLTDEVRDLLQRWGKHVCEIVTGKLKKKTNVVSMVGRQSQ